MTGGSSPADIVFSPDGSFLVVSERPVSLLDVFLVSEDGSVGEKVVTPSNNLQPFGMMFTRKGILVVTEGASSYRLKDDGTLETVSRAVPTTQTAACWVRFSKDQRFAYVVNSGSGTISTYRISSRGELTSPLFSTPCPKPCGG